MNYIDWEFYHSLFSEITTEETFEKQNEKAQLKLDTYSRGRIKAFMTDYDEQTATDFQKQVYAQIKMTVCEMVNLIQTQETSKSRQGLSSVSNDGYSESYNIETIIDSNQEMLSVIRNGLAGTGMIGACYV